MTEEDLLKAKSLPDEFDWRNVYGKNYVSPVRNQFVCGSCYAFGTLAMFEARVRILSNDTKTPVFSTLDVVSCSEYSQGCEGGRLTVIAGCINCELSQEAEEVQFWLSHDFFLPHWGERDLLSQEICFA